MCSVQLDPSVVQDEGLGVVEAGVAGDTSANDDHVAAGLPPHPRVEFVVSSSQSGRAPASSIVMHDDCSENAKGLDPPTAKTSLAELPQIPSMAVRSPATVCCTVHPEPS